MNTTDTFTNNSLIGRYNKKFAYLIGGSGALSLIMSIIELLTGRVFPTVFIISGISSLLMSYLFLTKPCFTYEDSELCLYNWGIKVKKYQLASLKELTVENNKIYSQRNDKKRKIHIPKLIVDKDDWNNLVAQIKQ